MAKDKPEAPATPDIGAATREGIEAYTENLPNIIDIQTQYQPRITDAAIKSGREQYFSAQDALAEGMNRYGDDILDSALKLEGKYGPQVAKQYVENMRSAAPGYFNVRDQYESALSDDLALGGQLSDQQRMITEQAVRSGQSARGNIRGTAPTAQEAMMTFLASENLRDKRLGRAGQYAASPAPGVTMGTSPNAMSLYSGTQAPQFSAPQLNASQGVQYGQQGANMAQQQYGQAYSGYQNAVSNYQSPWATAGQLGLAGVGIASGLGWAPFAAGAAGAAGGAGGLAMSDKRLKKDIKKIGEKDGINWYEYSYIWDNIKRVGVMAQEVIDKIPDAVKEMPNGYLAVDYSKI